MSLSPFNFINKWVYSAVMSSRVWVPSTKKYTHLQILITLTHLDLYRVEGKWFYALSEQQSKNSSV